MSDFTENELVTIKKCVRHMVLNEAFDAHIYEVYLKLISFLQQPCEHEKSSHVLSMGTNNEIVFKCIKCGEGCK